MKLSKGSADALYLLRRFRVTGRHLSIDLRPLGRADLRFRVRRKFSETDRCGTRVSVREGAFKGALEFEGEGSFATIDRRRIEGRVATLRKRSCGSNSRAGRGLGKKGPSLWACGPDPGTGFYAMTDLEIPSFGAFAFERRPYASVFSSASTFAKPEDFQVTPDRRSATFSPPGTWFVGSGAYQAGMTSGNLASDLPGFGRVPLVPGEAILTRDEDEDFTCPGFRGLGRTMPTVTADRVAGKQRLALGFRHRAIRAAAAGSAQPRR